MYADSHTHTHTSQASSWQKSFYPPQLFPLAQKNVGCSVFVFKLSENNLGEWTAEKTRLEPGRRPPQEFCRHMWSFTRHLVQTPGRSEVNFVMMIRPQIYWGQLTPETCLCLSSVLWDEIRHVQTQAQGSSLAHGQILYGPVPGANNFLVKENTRLYFIPGSSLTEN